MAACVLAAGSAKADPAISGLGLTFKECRAKWGRPASSHYNKELKLLRCFVWVV
jgi:hypothetical protein